MLLEHLMCLVSCIYIVILCATLCATLLSFVPHVPHFGAKFWNLMIFFPDSALRVGYGRGQEIGFHGTGL